MVTVPESIVARNVPPIPHDRVADLLPYENIRTAIFSDWHPKERRILIRTRFAQSPQLHEVAMPMGYRTQLTFFNDPVAFGTARPERSRPARLRLNEGGAENFQLFLLDRKAGSTRRFTDGKGRYLAPVWSHTASCWPTPATPATAATPDLYVADPAVPGQRAARSPRSRAPGSPLDWSPDDRRILLLEEISANETYLHWIDVASGEVHDLTPRIKKGEEDGLLAGARCGPRTAAAVYTATDRDSEFLRLVRMDVDGRQDDRALRRHALGRR